MRFIVFVLVGLFCGAANADTKNLKVRDSQGRVKSSVKVSGTKLTFKDSQGRITAYGTIKKNSVQLRDAQGRRK